jgi:urate oxidase
MEFIILEAITKLKIDRAQIFVQIKKHIRRIVIMMEQIIWEHMDLQAMDPHKNLRLLRKIHIQQTLDLMFIYLEMATIINSSN